MRKPIRLRVLTGLCALLRHPAERIEYPTRALTRCPCGYIEMYDRAVPGA